METVLNAWQCQLQNSSDDYDLDALPVHIMRTDSFQGLPGHEELVDVNRGLPIFNHGSTVVDMMENEFNDDYSWSGGVIPMPPKLANRTAKVNLPCSWDLEINTTTLTKFPQSGEPENIPFLLMKTHFEVKMPLQVTECTINNCLKDMPNISKQVFADKCTVSCVFSFSSYYFKIPSHLLLQSPDLLFIMLYCQYLFFSFISLCIKRPRIQKINHPLSNHPLSID